MRLIVPLLLWTAISLGLRGTVLLYFGILVTSITATVIGLGPLSAFDFLYATEQLWLYLIVIGCTSLTLAAAVAQRDDARRQHEVDIIDRMRIERERSISRERERILRDMHDGIGGQLTSILSMVQRGSATNDEVGEALRRTLDDLRILIDSIGAGDEGLPEMLGRLRARLESVLRRNGLHATWKIDATDALDSFDPGQALHILRIIQEAVANVVQHAQATELEIRVFEPDLGAPTLAIEITDNGVGSSPDATVGGHGIRNMKARAEALGAELRFEIGESGRSVLLLIPISTPS
jgi:signal transduction histidine kinase